MLIKGQPEIPYLIPVEMFPKGINPLPSLREESALSLIEGLFAEQGSCPAAGRSF